jgi:hypothetical protein
VPGQAEDSPAFGGHERKRRRRGSQRLAFPVCFRLVLEVTSGNWKDDLRVKAGAYAEAKVPVYVVVDRKHQRLHVLTDPDGSEYGNHRVHAPGETVTLPGTIGAEVTLDVEQIITAGQRKAG